YDADRRGFEYGSDKYSWPAGCSVGLGVSPTALDASELSTRHGAGLSPGTSADVTEARNGCSSGGHQRLGSALSAAGREPPRASSCATSRRSASSGSVRRFLRTCEIPPG